MYRVMCAAVVGALMATIAPARAACSPATLGAYTAKLEDAEADIEAQPEYAREVFADYYERLGYCIDTTHEYRARWIVGLLRERAAIGYAWAVAEQGHFTEARVALQKSRARLAKLRRADPPPNARDLIAILDRNAREADNAVHRAQATASIK